MWVVWFICVVSLQTIISNISKIYPFFSWVIFSILSHFIAIDLFCFINVCWSLNDTTQFASYLPLIYSHWRTLLQPKHPWPFHSSWRPQPWRDPQLFFAFQHLPQTCAEPWKCMWKTTSFLVLYVIFNLGVEKRCFDCSYFQDLGFLEPCAKSNVFKISFH